MHHFANRLIALIGGTVAFALAASAFTLSVQYKPFGVPDSRRAEYEAKVASLREKNRLLRSGDDEARPVVVLAKKTHDFGMLDPHTTATHRFKIRNDGQHPLALEVEQTSCKCTAGNLEEDLLDPGQSTTLELTWNTGYKSDGYEQTATIRTNDPVRPTVTLKVKGQVRAQLITPETIIFSKADLGEVTEAKFVVYSQTWDSFEIAQVDCDVPGFEWYAEPIAVTDPRLADLQAASAWEVQAHAALLQYGKFKGKATLTARPTDGQDEVTRELAYSGKVRAPISFYSPDIHQHDGLDMGTMVAGKKHQFHLVVRARGDQQRQIDVLDVEPKELTATLRPMSKAGEYRLSLTVPPDCPMVVFNADQKHGYVQVGDVDDKSFSNWFPVMGAVVELDD